MNQINRNNYETFFLLYTDNELTGAEKKAVDEFVMANPDLEAELILLQQTVVKPTAILFTATNSLLKNEPFNSELEEKLLLKLDNELSTKELKAINQLIVNEAAYKNEWHILQQTKLQADEAVVFNDKPSLYRKEGGRIIAFPWRKIAVAAILIGIGLLGTLKYFNNSKVADNGSLANVPKIEPPSAENKLTAKQPATSVNDTINKIADNSEVALTPVPAEKFTAEKIKYAPKIIPQQAIENKETETAIVKPKDNNLPKSYLENNNNEVSNKNTIANVTPSKQTDKIEDASISKNTAMQDAAKMYATTAAFNENNEANNDQVLYMNEEKVKKSKLGGLFRKVKRVIERNTNIKTGGNNLKVANLEFAIQ